MIERYRAAERFLPQNMLKLVKNGTIDPHWISDTAFYYRRTGRDGQETVLYEVETDEFSPYPEEEISDPVQSLPEPLLSHIPLWAPDGRSCVYTKDFDLWFSVPSEEIVRRLTFDGALHHSYGLLPDISSVSLLFARMGKQQTAGVTWSPDSRRIICFCYDDSGCDDFVFTETAFAPSEEQCRAFSLKMPFYAGGRVPVLTYYAIDVETGARVKLAFPEGILPEQGMQMAACVLHWNADCTKALLIGRRSAGNYACVMEADLTSGECRIVFEEENGTFLSFNTLLYNRFNVRVIKGGREILWFSERSGWGHLYRYDLESGTLLGAVTSGEWLVRDLLEVDEAHETVYFSAAGMEPGADPYYRKICRVGFDGSDLIVLTPENADHVYENQQSNPFLGEGSRRFPNLSPDMRYLVDTYSTVSDPPVTVIRRTSDGGLVKILEKADITGLREIGWQPPDRFCVKAADGITDLFGVIYKPSDFDPAKKYPVIDSVYNSPEIISAPAAFMDGMYPGVPYAIIAGQDSRAIAELGFIVVGMDSRGTPGRSKAFHDCIFRSYDDFGLEDHVAALRALAKTRPYFDTERIGVYGHSYGGFASCKAILKYPDVFKVCISSAAVQDFRRSEDIASRYYGGRCSEEEYCLMDNAQLAENLKGRLLLVYGEHDENVRYDQYTHIADALIKAGKEFDLIYLPKSTHRLSLDPYFKRRRMDYFVRNLLGEEPPKDYAFA